MYGRRGGLYGRRGGCMVRGRGVYGRRVVW